MRLTAGVSTMYLYSLVRHWGAAWGDERAGCCC